MASISTRGFTAICIYLAALLFFINTFTLATPTPHAPCDDVPCIAGCLSDAHATQPASCSKNDPAKATECLCATVRSVAPHSVFANCVMECGVKEREILTNMCWKHDVTEDQDNGKNKEHKKIDGHNSQPKKYIGGDTRVKDIASKDNDDDDDFDEPSVDDSVDDNTDDDEDKNDGDGDDDDHPVKTPDVVTNINMEKDDGLEEDDIKKNTVVINRKGDAYSVVASMRWTTIGAVGAAVLVMI